MVAKAKDDLEQELVDKEAEKERYLAEKAPPLHTREMSFAELQVCPHLTKLYWDYYRIIITIKYVLECYRIPKSAI